jgi:CBS domain-containing protein
MQLSDLMTHDVEVVRPNTSLRAAAKRMRELNVGVMPVCAGKRVVGILTDRDIAVRAVAEGDDPNDTTVEEVMTRDVAFAYEDQSLEEAAELMEQFQIRRLPILDRNEELVGILSLGDLAVDGQDEKLKAQVVEGVSYPARPER